MNSNDFRGKEWIIAGNLLSDRLKDMATYVRDEDFDITIDGIPLEQALKEVSNGH